MSALLLLQPYSLHDHDHVATMSLAISPSLGPIVVPACTLYPVFDPIWPVVPFVAGGIGLRVGLALVGGRAIHLACVAVVIVAGVAVVVPWRWASVGVVFQHFLVVGGCLAAARLFVMVWCCYRGCFALSGTGWWYLYDFTGAIRVCVGSLIAFGRY